MGDCYCADQKTIVDEGVLTGLRISPLECLGRCQGNAASQSGEYCGNEGTAAIYSTYHNHPQRPDFIQIPPDWHRPIIRRMRFMETESIPTSQSTMTGIHTNLFTLFPELTTVQSPRLIIHASHGVYAPHQAHRCENSDCFDPCGSIWYEEDIDDNRDEITIRAFYINLKDIFDRLGTEKKKVYLFAQIVEIDETLHFPFALVIRARKIILDRGKSFSLTVDRSAPPLVDAYWADNDKGPAGDTLFMKQSYTCARILMNTKDPDHVTTAMEMLDEIVNDFPYDKEHAAWKTGVRMHRAEFAGARRDGVHWVPIYTKEYFKARLDFHHDLITEWMDKYIEIVKVSTIATRFLTLVTEMCDIFTSTNIGQWQLMYAQTLETLAIGQARYNAVYNNYTVSRDHLDEAAIEYEKGLEKYQDEQTKKAKRGFIKGIARVCVGVFVPGGAKQAVGGVQDIVGALKRMEETMDFLTLAMEKTEAMMGKLDYMMQILEDALSGGNLEDLAGDIEMLAQLYVMEVGWDNLKHNSEIVLQDSIDKKIEGADGYLVTLLDTSNWGMALTAAMIELSENYRQAVLVKSLLDSKIEMQERYQGYLDELATDIDLHRNHMLLRMSDMQHDLRNDVNDLILSFCEYYFYENQRECSVVPAFDGTMTQVLLQLHAARTDGLFGSGVPGSVCRPLIIQDTNTNPNCSDVTVCPINMLKKTRILHYTVDKDHPDLIDIQRYRVGRIHIDVVGAKTYPDSPNDRLKLEIESTSPFSVRRLSTWYEFIARALQVVHEYEIGSGRVTWRANLYDPLESSAHCHHRSPFTTWVVRVATPTSDHIDLSDVTHVEIIFDGTGVNGKGEEIEPDLFCLPNMVGEE